MKALCPVPQNPIAVIADNPKFPRTFAGGSFAKIQVAETRWELGSNKYRMVKQLCMSLVDFAMNVDSLGADWRIPHLDPLISSASRSKRWTSTSSLGIDHLLCHVIFHGH